MQIKPNNRIISYFCACLLFSSVSCSEKSSFSGHSKSQSVRPTQDAPAIAEHQDPPIPSPEDLTPQATAEHQDSPFPSPKDLTPQDEEQKNDVNSEEVAQLSPDEQETKPESEPAPAPEVIPEPEVQAGASVPDLSRPHFQACKETPNYDPTDFQCNVPVSASTQWDRVKEWVGYENQMVDKSANWMSTATLNKYGSCSSYDEKFQLVYISHFQLNSAKKVRVQTIIDNLGAVIIWQNGDPNKEVFNSNDLKAFYDVQIDLEDGFYAILIDARESSHPSAGGVVVSLLDQDNSVIKSSDASDGSWCMFLFERQPGYTLANFVINNASCRSCLIGQDAVNEAASSQK